MHNRMALDHSGRILAVPKEYQLISWHCFLHFRQCQWLVKPNCSRLSLEVEAHWTWMIIEL